MASKDKQQSDSPSEQPSRKPFTIFPRDATAKEILEGLKKLREKHSGQSSESPTDPSTDQDA